MRRPWKREGTHSALSVLADNWRLMDLHEKRNFKIDCTDEHWETVSVVFI
jgi:hypothetical protein